MGNTHQSNNQTKKYSSRKCHKGEITGPKKGDFAGHWGQKRLL